MKAAVRAALLGGVTAGALDIAYACGQAALHGRSPLRILQSVASGLLGSAAFQGGLTAGLIGLAAHFVITIGAAAMFVAAYARVPAIRSRALAAGALFGVLVYGFMHAVVLPLSAIPFQMSYPPARLAEGLAVHVLLVGLPIAWCARRAMRRVT